MIKLFLKVILLLLIATSLLSLDLSVVEAIFDEDDFELMMQSAIAEKEGRLEDAIALSFRRWQNRREAFGLLFIISLHYNELNNPEMSGRFFLESLKRATVPFNEEGIDKQFSNVYASNEFQKYLNEALVINKQRRINQGTISYIEITSKIRYRTILPDNFSPDNEYPTVIFMHDSGRFPLENLDGDFGLLRENGIILVVPEAPFPWEWSILVPTSFSWEIAGRYAEQSNQITMNHILNLNRAIKGKYNVASMFLAGLSQGGAHALSIGLQNQNSFDGLISFDGDLSLAGNSVVENGKIPVLIISTDTDLAAYERLKAKGYKVEKYQFDGDYSITSDTVQKVISWISEN